jgi:hypothetical protein
VQQTQHIVTAAQLIVPNEANQMSQSQYARKFVDPIRVDMAERYISKIE